MEIRSNLSILKRREVIWCLRTLYLWLLEKKSTRRLLLVLLVSLSLLPNFPVEVIGEIELARVAILVDVLLQADGMVHKVAFLAND